MKKVVSITIGGMVFSIEEDAYGALSEYLTAIRDRFKATDEAEEIVDDIELSIAEKFSKKKKPQIIRSKDVETIIAEMGTVEDFEKELSEIETDASGSDDPIQKLRKKLYRNTDDQIIAGVASGLAAYFGVDPVFIRLLFVLSIFLHGFGILAYLVLWVVMPPAETVAQKLEMKGDPITLQQFEKMLKDKLSPETKERTSSFAKVLRAPFELLRGLMRAFGALLRSIGPLIRVAFGLVLIVVSFGAALALTVALTGVHFSVNSGLFELPVRDFLTGTEYAIGLGAVYLLFLIPGAMGVMLGASLMKRQNKFSGVMLALFAVVWFGSLFVVGDTASALVPQYRAYIENMPIATQEHQLEAFDQIEVFSGDSVVIRQGEEYSISFTGKEASVEDRSFEVHSGVLTVSDGKRDHVCIGCFQPSVDVVITTPALSYLEAAHGSRAVIELFETDSLVAEFKHGSTGEIDIVATKMKLVASHASQVTVRGSVEEVSAEIYYAARVDTSDLESEKTSVELDYSSSAEIGSTDVLNITAQRSSSVQYVGEPELTEDISESSSVRKKF